MRDGLPLRDHTDPPSNRVPPAAAPRSPALLRPLPMWATERRCRAQPPPIHAAGRPASAAAVVMRAPPQCGRIPPLQEPPEWNDAAGGGGGQGIASMGGGTPLSPNTPALTLPQRHSHTPTPAPTAFPTASNRPPTAVTSPVTALQPLWNCPDRVPPF